MEDYDGRKEAVLKAAGAFNQKSHTVRDELFRSGEFFDPRDKVQVKYEMLRRVREDGMDVSQAARLFGFSRVAYYQIADAFEKEGLRGLLPRQHGPRHAHKLDGEVMDFILRQKSGGTSPSSTELAYLVRKRFGLKIHSRSIERAVERRLKKGRHTQRI